ncbi:glycosyltransferase family 4 protein [Hyphococcus sp.]|uniref:glycosyltransferase family 4 protein n=1 Tax=Hyphococcus sp. TaxID=2038636 RepID=UPI00207EF06D|nr:MAG: hypothetical protein DHS20C04_16280 [Marinicaulis sp.]
MQFDGLISGGLMGADPFDPSSWSGSSAAFFDACRENGLLRHAFGVDVTRAQLAAIAIPRFSPQREVWRRKVYKSITYRRALERALPAAMAGSHDDCPIVQLGAYVNLRDALNTNRPWLTYQDGNSAEYANNPFVPEALRQNVGLHEACIDYEKKIANDADKVLTTSEWLRRSFIERYGLTPEKVVSIGCGVNAPLPETVPNKDYSSKEMLFIGKEFERKGGDVAVAALNIVRKKFPDAVLHVVGPSSLPAACRNTPGLVFHGFLSRRNPEQAARQKALFANCSLFLAPSRYEPFGIAPLEAMGWGAAAIVTGQWALAENIEPGVTGRHVKVGDAAGLADEVIAFFEAPDRLARYGAAARDHVMKKHRWTNVVERLSAVLNTLQT